MRGEGRRREEGKKKKKKDRSPHPLYARADTGATRRRRKGAGKYPHTLRKLTCARIERMKIMRSMKASRAVRGARCARAAGGGDRRASSSSAAAAAAVAASATTKERKASPLEAGGTLEGKEALGKDAAVSTIKKSDSASASGSSSSSSSYWSDDRWVKGRWDYNQFKNEKGETDWDAVLDAEVVRRKALEENPSPSMLEDPVEFDTSEVPWWVWVRRYHLPEAELVNGRAAMVGYFLGYVVDALTGHGLVDQTSGFLGKTLIFATVLGVIIVRNTDDIKKFQGLADEATFYDKQVRRCHATY